MKKRKQFQSSVPMIHLLSLVLKLGSDLLVEYIEAAKVEDVTSEMLQNFREEVVGFNTSARAITAHLHDCIESIEEKLKHKASAKLTPLERRLLGIDYDPGI